MAERKKERTDRRDRGRQSGARHPRRAIKILPVFSQALGGVLFCARRVEACSRHAMIVDLGRHADAVDCTEVDGFRADLCTLC